MNFLLPIILFAQFATPFETRVFLDADGQFLIYTRYFQDNLLSIDSIISVDEYLDTGLQTRNLNFLLEELKKDMLQEGGYASKGLFGTFEIPLPKGGFGDFMGETGKLDVGGYVKITLGGSETFISNVPGGAGPSLFPELEMKQEMAISLDGQVGDRMRVYIDHNSERINESQNKITVTYMGREDDIIQEVEGGDTQLEIPGTMYTGDIPSHSGLFGIKSTAKIGPLNLVAIASNEQTQTQEIEIEGSIQTTYDTLWVRYYERRRFFEIANPGEALIDLQVYVDDNNAQNNNIGITYYGEAFLDLNDDNVPDDTSNPTNYKEGYFTYKLEGLSDFYRFEPGSNIIELNYALPNQHVLGVSYKKLVSGDTIEVGKLENDTIQLKLICPEQLDTTSFTWEYERKNYYQVVSAGSRLDSLRIYYITSGGEHKDRQDNIPYIEVLDLDTLPRDGQIDENRVWFPSRGLLIFPDERPFASNDLDDQDHEIYTNPYMIGKGKYYIYKKTVEATPVYTLPDNIVKVWVYVDDILQDSIHDYHVDYEEGILEFKKPIPPTAKIRIKTEYSPFFSAAQKSLIGVRGSLRPFGDASLGSSFFYRTESYPAEHIRLREEPFNRMVWEVDFSLPQKVPFITKLVDVLPLVQTEAESKLNLNFEAAYSISNLNSSGEVWLDDLESSTILTNDVSITKSSWVLCSKPVGLDTSYFATQKLIWYNPQDQDRLQASDIYADPIDPNEIADVLKITYSPRLDKDTSFAGLTQYIYNEDLDENENLELIIKGNGGRIHVDIAQEIDEDQLRRNKNGNLIGIGTLEDEDQNPKNGTWTEQDEDTGLDGVFGADTLDVAGDDGNDDYKEKDYTGGINGTEGNRLWDTEDIDHNGIRNSENRYYSYSVHLDSTERLVQEAGLQDGWKMFRIPIKDSSAWDSVINQPDWHNIKYIRIWFDEFANTETLLIYKLGTTGSRWKNYGIEGDKSAPDSTEIFTITPVNTKTHTYYQPPYPTEKDPLTGETKSEGGLELRIENVKEGHTCIAHRRTDDYEDYRAYDTLTFYLNARNSNPMISMRIGSDSLNYYEYRTEYLTGGIRVYNDYRLFHVSLQRFTGLKKMSAGDSTISESEYTVVGNPSLAGNQFLELRIENQFTTALTDTLWFNDVKLVTPKTEIGRTLRGNGSINFADFASLSFSYNESNGRFKRLTESKDISTSSAGRNYSVNSAVSLNKFLPESWGFSIPVGFNYNKSTIEPRYSYLANDLELTDEERVAQQTISRGKSYTVHISKANSKNWFLKHTLDRLSFDHSRSNTYYRSVNNNDTTQTITYSASYSLDPQLSFQIFNQSFYIFPQNVSFSAYYTDNLSKSYYRSDPDSAYQIDSIYGLQHRKTLNPSFSVSYSPHSMLNTSFNFSQMRDSVSQKGRFGEEVSRHQSFDASVSQDLIIVSPRLSFNSSYDEDHRFEIRQDQDLRNVSNSTRYGASGTVNIKQIVQFFTGLRDETKDSLSVAGSPAWFARQVETFINVIQNPTLNFSRSRYSNYLNVKTRPHMKYQWGLQDSIPSDDVAAGSFPGRGVTDSYGASSGIGFKFVSIQGGYNGQISRAFNYGGGETRTTSISYPNLSIRLSRLETLPFLKNISRSSSISSSFNQFFDKRHEIVDDSLNLTSDSKTISFSPLISWQSNWVKGISTTIDITYSEVKGNSYLGATVVPSRSLNRGGSASIAYTFSAPRGIRMPLLGGLKFSSNLSMNLGVNYNRSTTYSLDLDNPTNDTQTMGANIGLSYNFSASITGGANFDYSQNKEMNSNQDSRRVGLNIWTNINF